MITLHVKRWAESCNRNLLEAWEPEHTYRIGQEHRTNRTDGMGWVDDSSEPSNSRVRRTRTHSAVLVKSRLSFILLHRSNLGSCTYSALSRLHAIQSCISFHHYGWYMPRVCLQLRTRTCPMHRATRRSKRHRDGHLVLDFDEAAGIKPDQQSFVSGKEWIVQQRSAAAALPGGGVR